MRRLGLRPTEIHRELGPLVIMRAASRRRGIASDGVWSKTAPFRVAHDDLGVLI
jgi:hypothetical protein